MPFLSPVEALGTLESDLFSFPMANDFTPIEPCSGRGAEEVKNGSGFSTGGCAGMVGFVGGGGGVGFTLAPGVGCGVVAGGGGVLAGCCGVLGGGGVAFPFDGMFMTLS